MTDQPSKSAIKLANSGAENAPFIYFDGAVAFGTLNGAIQIELAASTLLPEEGGKVKTVHIITAHLRCSPKAAADLRRAIDRALLLGTPTEGKAN